VTKATNDFAVVRYGRSASAPEGVPYDPDRCAREVFGPNGNGVGKQCSRDNGHGPGRLYCHQHARMFK
jgi:hypothetical protein